MGLIRKTMSVSTLGLVPYRNQAERANKIAKQTRNAARLNAVQNAELIELQREQLAQAEAAQVMRATQVAAMLNQQPAQQPMAIQGPPPPGWYPDPLDRAALMWWDGAAWNFQTKHYPERPHQS